MRKNKFLLLIIPFIGILGCKKNPVDRLTDPLASGAVPTSSGIFMIYDDELKTGGGLAFIPGGENQSINMGDRSAAYGARNIKYEWNGGDVTDNTQTPPVPEHNYAGFQLLIAANATLNPTATPKDLSAPGYTTLKFSARGTLSQDTIVRIEGPNHKDGVSAKLELNSSQLSSQWAEYSMSLAPQQLTSVQTFFTVTFQYSQAPRVAFGGNGGVIYFDNIRYEK